MKNVNFTTFQVRVDMQTCLNVSDTSNDTVGNDWAAASESLSLAEYRVLVHTTGIVACLRAPRDYNSLRNDE